MEIRLTKMYLGEPSFVCPTERSLRSLLGGLVVNRTPHSQRPGASQLPAFFSQSPHYIHFILTIWESEETVLFRIALAIASEGQTREMALNEFIMKNCGL
jgi:hypothetical protein